MRGECVRVVAWSIHDCCEQARGGQRDKMPDECLAMKPWSGRCDPEEMKRTYNALADDGVRAFRGLEGMSTWSLEVLLEIKTKFIQCLFDSVKKTRLERWPGRSWSSWQDRSLHHYLCTACKLVPEDDFTWFFTRHNGPEGTGLK